MLHTSRAHEHHVEVTLRRTSRISVRRGDTIMPLYPSGAVGNATESPWSKLVGEMYRLYTLEVPEHEHGSDFTPVSRSFWCCTRSTEQRKNESCSSRI
jgi:hypothetical protein